MESIHYKQGQGIAEHFAQVEQEYGYSLSVLLERARLGLHVPSEAPLAWIKYRNVSSSEVQSIPCYEDVPPHYYTMLRYCNGRVWDWYEIIPSAQKQIFAEHSDAGPEHRVVHIKGMVKRNADHAELGIYLHLEQTLTCDETGISFKCNLPVPSKLNLAINHPLAHMENVRKVMQEYKRHGLHIEHELEPQVLVGMLLTTLRNHSLLICKDSVRANLFLQSAGKEVLGSVLRFFYSRSSTLGFPALSLNLEDSLRIAEAQANWPESARQKARGNAEAFLINYVRACRGDSTIDEPAHIKFAPSKEQRKVRIYTDTLQAQHKAAQSKAKDGTTLLGKLVAAYPGQHNVLFASIKTNLKGLAFLSAKFREQVASKLRDTFPANTDAHDLASIFSGVQQDAIEDDLESFTQSVKREISQYKAGKVDFMSKLKKQGA